MVYTAKEQHNLHKGFQDSSGQTWKFLSKKEYKHLPNDEKKIYADALKKDSHSAGMTLVYEKQSLGLYTYTGKSQLMECTLGYIPVVDEQGQIGCVRVRKRSWILPILLILTVGIVAAALFFHPQGTTDPSLDDSAIAYRIDGVENTDPSKIMLPGMDTITLKANEQHVEQILLNPKGNPCYFRFRLILEPEEEILFESKLVEPGTAITEFDIEHGLKQGVYDARMEVQTFDLEDKEAPLNNGVIQITLNVEK